MRCTAWEWQRTHSICLRSACTWCPAVSATCRQRGSPLVWQGGGGPPRPPPGRAPRPLPPAGIAAGMAGAAALARHHGVAAHPLGAADGEDDDLPGALRDTLFVTGVAVHFAVLARGPAGPRPPPAGAGGGGGGGVFCWVG